MRPGPHYPAGCLQQSIHTHPRNAERGGLPRPHSLRAPPGNAFLLRARRSALPLDWDNIMDTENRAFRLERCSNYARETLRQAIQALRREIGSRGRDPGQGAVRSAQRAVLHPQKVGGKYEADGEDAFPGSGNPVANKDHEILKLKKENEELRKEVAILKKFRAFSRQAQA